MKCNEVVNSNEITYKYLTGLFGLNKLQIKIEKLANMTDYEALEINSSNK